MIFNGKCLYLVYILHALFLFHVYLFHDFLWKMYIPCKYLAYTFQYLEAYTWYMPGMYQAYNEHLKSCNQLEQNCKWNATAHRFWNARVFNVQHRTWSRHWVSVCPGPGGGVQLKRGCSRWQHRAMIVAESKLLSAAQAAEARRCRCVMAVACGGAPLLPTSATEDGRETLQGPEAKRLVSARSTWWHRNQLVLNVQVENRREQWKTENVW
jgi:hypothetical protein